MNATILLAAQETTLTAADLSFIVDSLITGIFYILCSALAVYAVFILFKSTDTLLIKRPQIEEKKEAEKYEEKLTLPIGHSKVYAALMFILFSISFIILEMSDLLSSLMNAKLITFTILIFINLMLAFADTIFESAKKNRRVIIACSALVISGQYLITIVMNSDQLITIRVLLGLLLLILNIINIYGLTKKAASD